MVRFIPSDSATEHDILEGHIYNVWDDHCFLGYIAVEWGEPYNMLHVHISHPITLGLRLKIFRHFKKHYPYPFSWER